MKKSRPLFRAITLGILGILAACNLAQAAEDSKPAVLELRTSSWLFNSTQPAHSTLTTQAPQAEFAAHSKTKDGFTIKLTADLKKFDADKTILEIPGVLSVRLRQHNPGDRKRQNYPAFKMPDGTVPVLEANLTLASAEHPKWQGMTIGIPLALLKQPGGKHDIVLNFSGVRWTMFVDGQLLDNDFPFGYPTWTEKNTWKLDAEFVSKAEIFLPAIKPAEELAKTRETAPIQYWTPHGHNNWVGDVVSFFHKGRYHVFYLFDRRHHESKFGQGAHYFEHISTTDFKTWTEHEAATPLEEQWECIGTGTPFVFKDKFCIGYGLHTTRVYPKEKTSLPTQWDYLKKNGVTGEFKFETTPGFPAGSTYAISEDGVSSFKKSRLAFHPCENPSVYTDPNGKLRLLANFHSKGMWESESVNSGWRCTSPDFPPGGDCTFFFRWGKFDYIIGGFKDLWSKPADAPDTKYESVAAKGLDFYDGSNVPAITEINGGRFVMAAWIPIRGWGGPLVIRELIQFNDGRIGSKWMKEVTPQTGTPKTLAASLSDTTTYPTDGASFMLSFDVHPAEAGKGRFGVVFLPEADERASGELQIRLNDKRAQFASGSLSVFAFPQKSLREGNMPHAVRNYSIENLIGVDGSFTVRVIVKNSEKMGGALVDAEIAGQRTMISYREDLTVKKMLFRMEGVELKNVQIAPLKE